MKTLYHVVFLLSCLYVSGIILPLTKTDGSLDVSSLLSHISLLEQTITNKASADEMNQLKSDLAASQKELSETKTQLTVVTSKLDDLKDVKEDLSKAQTEIVVMKNLLVLKDNQCSCNSSNTGGTQITHEVIDLATSVSLLKTEVLQIQSLHNKTGGSTFTRWGRTYCPADSTIVYKGYTGGTRNIDNASSASILCLPDQPIYANHTGAGHDGSWGSHIYGTEYNAFYDGSPFRHLHNENMPCVVCESKTKSDMIMVPARSKCFTGWTLEYSGYLMGPSYNLASGEYICVDSDAEAITGGSADQIGQVMYPVESRCGSLPCPPYHDKWELTCAVCSK